MKYIVLSGMGDSWLCLRVFCTTHYSCRDILEGDSHEDISLYSYLRISS